MYTLYTYEILHAYIYIHICIYTYTQVIGFSRPRERLYAYMCIMYISRDRKYVPKDRNALKGDRSVWVKCMDPKG